MYMMLAHEPVRAPVPAPLQVQTYGPLDSSQVPPQVISQPVLLEPPGKGTKRKGREEEAQGKRKKILLTDILMQPISSALVNLHTYWKFPNFVPLMEHAPLQNDMSIDISVKKRKGRAEIKAGVLGKKPKSFDSRTPDLFEPPYSFKGVRSRLPVAPENWRDVAPPQPIRRVQQRVYTPGVNTHLKAAIVPDFKLPFHYDDDPYDRLGRLIPKMGSKNVNVFLQELRKANENDTRIVSGLLQSKEKKTPKAISGHKEIPGTPPRVQRGRHAPGISPMKIVSETTSKMNRP